KSNDDAANELLMLLNQNGRDHHLLKYDVADPRQTEAVLNDWIASHPGAEIDILINNSGIRKDNLLIFMPENDWNEVINTNLNSFYYTTKIVSSGMVKRRKGRIINIVSLSGIKGMPGQTNYSASKGGLIAATKALAQELAKRNITVNAVAPGFIKTDMTGDLDEAELVKLIPANRFGTPQEVAELVAFLAGDKSGYITGQVISINGGLYS
ncbi:MAG TPA: 3-oxoacyl-ACP reductase FabG, partial [Saprospiraceae bacterium]|nr:3-oxoacyl-ACP reductase FabG [Saprospiraceae bacterium]